MLEHRKEWKRWKNSSFPQLTDNFCGTSHQHKSVLPGHIRYSENLGFDLYKPVPEATNLTEGTKITL